MKPGTVLIMGLMLALGLTTVQAQGPSGPDLVRRLGCLGCHSLSGKSFKGPSWEGLGHRLSPEVIQKQIVSPRGRMPNYAHLKPEELDALVQYLSGLK